MKEVQLFGYFKNGVKLHPVLNTFGVISDVISLSQSNLGEFNIDDRDKVYFLDKHNENGNKNKINVVAPYFIIRRESKTFDKNVGAKNKNLICNYELLCLMDDVSITKYHRVPQKRRYQRQEIFEITTNFILEIFSYTNWASKNYFGSNTTNLLFTDFVSESTNLSGQLCNFTVKLNCVEYNDNYWNQDFYWIDGDGEFIDDGFGNKIKVS